MGTGTIKRLLKLPVIAVVAATLFSCPMDLSLKNAIKGLAAPPDVSSLKIISPASKTFQLSWIDPADKDIDHIEISFSTPFATNPPPAAVNVAVGVQKATVNVPLNGVGYFIRVKTVDKAGNKSPGKTPINLNNLWSTLLSTSGLAAYMQVYNISGGLPGTPSWYIAYTYSGGTSGNQTISAQYNGAYPNGTLGFHDVFTYDANGNMTKDASYSDSPTPNTLQDYWIYTYDPNGNLTQRANYDSSSVEGSNQTLTYDSTGRLTSAVYYSSPGVESWSSTYYYDQDNRVVKEVHTDAVTPSNNYTNTYTWNSATGFPAQMTESGGTSGTATYTVTQSSLSVTSSFSSYNDTFVQNFNSYGLEVQDVESQSGISGGTPYSWSSEIDYNYDINGNKIDTVSYWNGTLNEHDTYQYY